jgi:hypothetical protein
MANEWAIHNVRNEGWATSIYSILLTNGLDAIWQKKSFDNIRLGGYLHHNQWRSPCDDTIAAKIHLKYNIISLKGRRLLPKIMGL